MVQRKLDEVSLPDLPKTSFLQVEYAAAVNGGNIETASEFINYLISPEVNSLDANRESDVLSPRGPGFT